MRLVTWNCQGAFRKKIGALARLAPDIAVVQECEDPQRLVFPAGLPAPDAFLWVGTNPWKGLGVFSFGGLELQAGPEYDESIRYFLPVRARGRANFNLVAAWARDDHDPLREYVGSLYRAVDYYLDFIREADALLAGDLNSNRNESGPPRIGNYADVVAKLAWERMVSAYHAFFRERHGEERRKTLYLHRDRFKGYHIDYCFIPKPWLPAVRAVKVGRYEEWIKYSDHMPVAVEIDEARWQ
jgi:exonuclease III